MLERFFKDISILKEAIEKDKLVIFVGAGISFDSGVPTWGELINEFKEEIDIPKEEQDYLKIAQIYYNERKTKEYIEKIRQTLKHKKCTANEIHKVIFDLKPEHIITTNYDDLLEQVIKENALPFSVIKKDVDFPYASNNNLLVKIHGDLDNTDIVLKEDDYLDYSLNHPLIEGFIKSIFASKVVLFVGYSYNDINLKMILQNVRTILGSNFQSAYLLNVDSSVHHAQREYLKNKGINVINYFDSDKGNNRNYINEYLKGRNAQEKKFTRKNENSKLSEKGSLTYNFLKFLSVYDKYNEPLNNKNIIDQIYYSLMRYNEAVTLPPEFITKLYPFFRNNDLPPNKENDEENEKEDVEEKSRLESEYNNYSILVRSKEIYKFFKSIKYDADNDKISIDKSILDIDIKTNQNENKIKRIIEKLNNSLIFYIVKENEKPDSFGYKGWSNEYVKLPSIKSTTCLCPKCQYYKFVFVDSLSKIEKYEISETSDITEDFRNTYVQYKFGNYIKSFQHYKSIASKAWRQGKYILYFIANNNIKNLRYLLRNDAYTSKYDIEEIIDYIDNIDLDKLILSIKDIDRNTYKLLRLIRENKVLKDIEDNIEEYSEKIKEIYSLYENGGGSHGPNYIIMIFHELLKLYLFYIHNHIIYDVFTRYKNIITNVFESLIISYKTSDKYQGKIIKVDAFVLSTIVYYGDSRKIKDIIGDNKIETLSIIDIDDEKILTIINNYFLSFFELNKFWNNVNNSTIIDAQLTNNYNFKEDCSRYFNNICILLSITNLKGLSHDKIDYLKTNLLNFLEAESFLYSNDISKYFSFFLFRQISIFNEKEVLRLLRIGIKRENAYFQNLSFIKSLYSYFSQNDNFKLNDNNLINTLLQVIEEKDKVKLMTYLFSMVDTAHKIIITNKITERLENKFDAELYRESVYKGILNKDSYIKEYIDKDISYWYYDDYSVVNNQLQVNHFYFHNFIYFIYCNNIELEASDIKDFDKLSDRIQYWLFPLSFDYAEFEVEWLLEFNATNECIYNKLKNIKPIKEILEFELQKNYNAKLSEIYVRYFLKDNL